MQTIPAVKNREHLKPQQHNASRYFQLCRSTMPMYILEAQVSVPPYYSSLSEALAYDERFRERLYETLLTEVRKRLLDPAFRRMIRSRRVRRKMLERCGPQAFLDPSASPYPKYPVMDPKCRYHCGLIMAAYLRARSRHREDIAQKAIALYKKLGCAEKIGIQIRQPERKTWSEIHKKRMIKRPKRVVKRPKIRSRHELYPAEYASAIR